MSPLHRTKMADYQQSEDHLRHCMLFHFRSGFNATFAIKKICEVYAYILKVNKYQGGLENLPMMTLTYPIMIEVDDLQTSIMML